jgi:hypothetical protein
MGCGEGTVGVRCMLFFVLLWSAWLDTTRSHKRDIFMVAVLSESAVLALKSATRTLHYNCLSDSKS